MALIVAELVALQNANLRSFVSPETVIACRNPVKVGMDESMSKVSVASCSLDAQRLQRFHQVIDGFDLG